MVIGRGTSITERARFKLQNLQFSVLAGHIFFKWVIQSKSPCVLHVVLCWLISVSWRYLKLLLRYRARGLEACMVDGQTSELKMLPWTCEMVAEWILYVPVNNLSVMPGRVLLGWTSIKQWWMCLAQGHNAVTLVRLESATTWFWVKHSITEPQHSLGMVAVGMDS